jgi:hypothetical protein
MNFDLLNSFGNTLGQGIGHVGNGLSYMGDTMSAGYDRASGFDAFGLGSGLRSGMADSGLSQNAIDNLMTAGKWGAGLGLAGAFMDGGQGAMQGLGMGLLGGGLGSYLQQHNKGGTGKNDNPYIGGLLNSWNDDPRNQQVQAAMQQAITPRFNAMPYQPMPMMPVGRI